MAVVTISRQHATGGSQVAAMVAQDLGWHSADKEVIATVLNMCGMGDFKKEYESYAGFWDRFKDRSTRRGNIVHMLDEAIKALAAHGDVVILGRGAFAPLQGLRDVLNVRTQAPEACRLAKVMLQEGIADAAKARRTIEENDKVRAEFIELAYQV